MTAIAFVSMLYSFEKALAGSVDVEIGRAAASRFSVRNKYGGSGRSFVTEADIRQRAETDRSIEVDIVSKRVM